MTTTTLGSLVAAVHRTDVRLVLAITGGGAAAIGELLRHGGGSRTLLSAAVPYHPEAFGRYAGGLPDQHCSPEAARDLAASAFQEAMGLAPVEEVVGVGATASLVKAGERSGRPHRVFVALQTADRTVTRSLELTASRSREGEEEVAAAFILDTIGEGCGIAAENRPTLPLAGGERVVDHETRAAEPIARVLAGRAPAAAHDLGPRRSASDDERPALLFPGSFNPLHEGHVRMAEVAHEWTGHAVDFEVAVVNPDKPPLNFTAMAERLEVFMRGHRPFFRRVWVTRAPTFLEKARLFPGACFVVGHDTFVRIGDPRYYGGPEAMRGCLGEMGESLGVRFLVFPRRKADGSVSTPEDYLALPRPLLAMAEFVPESLVREVVGVTSREIRGRLLATDV